jgi:hypothetical protein
VRPDVPVRVGRLVGPWGPSEAGPKGFPGPFLIFFILFLFLFWFFLNSFNYFANIDPVQFKQIPRAFIYSLQCFEIVINQVSKIKYISP